MPADSAIRASDADRERALAILRDAYAAGRLTLAEFDERSSAALSGRTWGDLRELTSDLPAGTGPGDGRAGLAPSWSAPSGPGPASTGPRPRPGGGPQPGPAEPATRLAPVVPVALIWLAVVLTAHLPGAMIPIIFLLMVGLGSTARHRGDQGSGCRCSHGHHPGRGGPG